MGRQTTKEQIEHAVLDGETCFTDPGVASGWFNSVPTEDLPTKATLGSDAAFAERVHQIPAGAWPACRGQGLASIQHHSPAGIELSKDAAPGSHC